MLRAEGADPLKIARDLGYSFDPDQLDSINSPQELSDSELESVTGGTGIEAVPGGANAFMNVVSLIYHAFDSKC